MDYAWADEKDLPEHIKTRLAGMRKRIGTLRKALSEKQLPRRFRGLELLPTAQWALRAEQAFRKLDGATWNVVNDSPNETAQAIKEYLSKVRKGLALDD